MMSIRRLPREVASQIAAGEIVERPASVVKELVENAIDAGATEIRVEVQDGGKKLIRVTDDGSGIPGDEVELAFEHHATSKLRTAEDLFALMTLGFRGEALPSIASISQVTVLTRTSEEEIGTQLRIEGGQVVKKQSLAATQGTIFSVERLFYNLPARRKFLKTTSSENGKISSIVSTYALAYPERRFSLTLGRRQSFQSPGSGALRDAVIAVYGLKVAKNMIELPRVEFEEGKIAVDGLIGGPALHRPNRKYITLFVNGRAVSSRLLMTAIQQAYQGVVPTGRHPLVVLRIEVPADEIDVNVHPQKQEVKFARSDEVFGAVQRAVRRRLIEDSPVHHYTRAPEALSPPPSTSSGRATRPDTPPVEPPPADVQFDLPVSRHEPQSPPDFYASAPPPIPPDEGEAYERRHTFSQPAADWDEQADGADEEILTRGRNASARPTRRRRDRSYWEQQAQRAQQANAPIELELSPNLSPDLSLDFSPPPPPPPPPEMSNGRQVQPSAQAPAQPTQPVPEAAASQLSMGIRGSEQAAQQTGRSKLPPLRVLGQLHKTFIICEGPDGLYLIDQHTAHERVLLERFQRERAKKFVPSQRLLTPLTLELTPQQMAVVEEQQDALFRLGFEIDPFGGLMVVVRAMPQLIQHHSDPAAALAEILDGTIRDRSGLSWEERLVMYAACRGAVKAGDPLVLDEMRELIRQLEQTDLARTCAHGRPTVVRLSQVQLEREFGRR